MKKIIKIIITIKNIKCVVTLPNLSASRLFPIDSETIKILLFNILLYRVYKWSDGKGC